MGPTGSLVTNSSFVVVSFPVDVLVGVIAGTCFEDSYSNDDGFTVSVAYVAEEPGVICSAYGYAGG